MGIETLDLLICYHKQEIKRRVFNNFKQSRSTTMNTEQQNWIDSNESEDLRCLQRIQESWNDDDDDHDDDDHIPNQSEVEQASRLACKGHLTEVNYMKLYSWKLKSIPRFDLMAELTQIVKEEIYIYGDSNIGPDNLSVILRNARCRVLRIWEVSWNASLTRLLVKSLDSVEELVLGIDAKVDLDTLTSYSGTGSCREIWFYDESFYGPKLKEFAHDKGWTYDDDDNLWYKIARL